MMNTIAKLNSASGNACISMYERRYDLLRASQGWGGGCGWGHQGAVRAGLGGQLRDVERREPWLGASPQALAARTRRGDEVNA